MLIGIVSCVALVGTAGKAVDEAITEASASEEASQQAEDDRNAPREVTPGEAFTICSHKVLDGWNVKVDTSLGDAQFNVTGKAKNVSEATSTMFVHFKFISKSGEVLGNVECTTGDLEPGQTETMNCRQIHREVRQAHRGSDLLSCVNPNESRSHPGLCISSSLTVSERAARPV